MKYARYIIYAAAVIASLTLVAWLMRNSLIQNMSSSLLRNYDIEVTDVSLDAISTSDATISYLELVHDEGTTIAIDGLALPVSTSPTGLQEYSAEKITINSSTRTEGEPLELALLIDQLLSLHGSVGDAEFSVDELSVPPYPPIRELQVVLLESEQSLRATVGDVLVSIAITPSDNAERTLVIALPGASPNAITHSISTSVWRDDQGISLGGLSSVDLSAWEPLANLAGLVPQELSVKSGTADLLLEIQIPYDASQSASVIAEITPSSALEVEYSGASGETALVEVASGSVALLTATFPEVRWSLRQQRASLNITYGEWAAIPLSITHLSCKSGPLCSMNTSVVLGAGAFPFGEIGHVALSSAENVVFLDDEIRVEVHAGATMAVTGLSMFDTNIAGISAQLVSAATLDLGDSGWRLEMDSLDAEVKALSLSENTAITIPLFLENLSLSDANQLLSATFGLLAPRTMVSFDESTVELPGFKGDFSLQGSTVGVQLQTLGLHQNAAIRAEHDLDTSAGQLTVRGAGASFDAKSLSSRVAPWRYDWDIAAGKVLLDIGANWAESDSGLTFDGQSSLRLEDLAGHYLDTAFVGLSTSLETAYDATSEFTAEPSTISVDLVEMGIAVEDISANYSLYPNDIGFDVANLRMTAFGGVILADPFSFRTASDTNTLTMRAKAIQIRELLTLEEFAAIQVSGTVGAELPIMITSDSVTISKGRLLGEPPGGVIRYLPATTTDETDTSSIAYVTRALGNFEYDTLTSDIDYNEAGDLILQLQLTGRSPELDQNRPVVLNLGVENNVPQMLKSLRAARTVEEILEKQLQD